MVLDTSALLAILFDEPERREFTEGIESAEQRLLSAASFVESSMILESRYGAEGVRALDRLLLAANIQIVDVDIAQARAAREAFRQSEKTGTQPDSISGIASRTHSRNVGQNHSCSGRRLFAYGGLVAVGSDSITASLSRTVADGRGRSRTEAPGPRSVTTARCLHCRRMPSLSSPLWSRDGLEALCVGADPGTP